MRVHGTGGLRVVDASVMPYVTNGNIYAPVMMIAEKSADLILGNQPLPPANVEFYRHGAEAAPADGNGRNRQLTICGIRNSRAVSRKSQNVWTNRTLLTMIGSARRPRAPPRISLTPDEERPA
jgi:hypothetical protein